MASGLIALVDDSIKSRWHRKDRFQLPIPVAKLSPTKLNFNYVGPKRLLEEVFHRRATTNAARHPTPIRQYTA